MPVLNCFEFDEIIKEHKRKIAALDYWNTQSTGRLYRSSHTVPTQIRVLKYRPQSGSFQFDSLVTDMENNMLPIFGVPYGDTDALLQVRSELKVLMELLHKVWEAAVKSTGTSLNYQKYIPSTSMRSYNFRINNQDYTMKFNTNIISIYASEADTWHSRVLLRFEYPKRTQEYQSKYSFQGNSVSRMNSYAFDGKCYKSLFYNTTDVQFVDFSTFEENVFQRSVELDTESEFNELVCDVICTFFEKDTPFMYNEFHLNGDALARRETIPVLHHILQEVQQMPGVYSPENVREILKRFTKEE